MKLLIYVLTLAACAQTGQPDPADRVSLVGTWVRPGEEITFADDGTYELLRPTGTNSGTWSVVNDTLRLNASTFDLRFDEDHLIYGNLMRGSSEIAAGSQWSQSSSTFGGGGSCSTISSSSALILESTTAARYRADSQCQPAGMGGSHVVEPGTWSPVSDGFTFIATRTDTYFLLGDAISTVRWDRVED